MVTRKKSFLSIIKLNMTFFFKSMSPLVIVFFKISLNKYEGWEWTLVWLDILDLYPPTYTESNHGTQTTWAGTTACTCLHIASTCQATARTCQVTIRTCLHTVSNPPRNELKKSVFKVYYEFTNNANVVAWNTYELIK